MQQTEKYWNLINRIVLIAIIIMAGVGVVLAFAPKVKQMKEHQARDNALQERIEITVNAENELKEKQRRFSTDRVFVERIAHEVGYARPGETIFHFPEETGANDAGH
jgi:cell division protein FtsB